MKLIDHLEGFISTRINIAKELFTLIRLEAKLAGLNVVPLLVNIGILFIIGLTLWPILMVLVAYLIYLLSENVLIAILGILALNLMIVWYLVRDSKIRAEQMSFAKTRKCFMSQELGDYNESKQEIALKTD